MTNQYPKGSVLAQLEDQRGEQQRVRAKEAIRRTGVENSGEVFEALSGYEPVKAMRQNQEWFLGEVKRIQNSVDLSDADRLEAGRVVATAAATKHQELADQLAASVNKRTAELDRTLFGTDDAAMLGSLAGLSADQLATRAAIAHSGGHRGLLKAIRAVAHTKGYEQVLEQAVALDSDQVARAYTERRALTADGVLNALALSYAPPAIEPRSLQTPHHVRQERERRKRSEEAASQRALGGGGLMDHVRFEPPSTGQVGRRRV